MLSLIVKIKPLFVQERRKEGMIKIMASNLSSSGHLQVIFVGILAGRHSVEKSIH